MLEKQIATLANFNCTFKIGDETYPMLDYFKKIIWPAFNDKNLIRTTYRKKNPELPIKYHISDTQIIELKDGNLALVGKHIKRTILEISEDYDKDQGFIGEPERKPSAPYSTFIILLHNHRVIYFPNKAGAPDIRSFATTVKSILFQYINNQRSELLNQLDCNNYPIKKAKEYMYKEFPTPEFNLVPIESSELVKEAFSNISYIKDVKFKFYKPNNEPLNFDNIFELSYEIIEKTKSTSLEQKINSPKEISVIEDAVTKSKGKTFYTINAVSNTKEPIKITPDKISPKITVDLTTDSSVVINSNEVYNQLKNRDEINPISVENIKLFEKLKSSLISLFR